MNVEDSYEGAVRRLRRLEHAGFNPSAPPPDSGERMRDLEELATLACEENERLTSELGETRGEVERLRQQVVTLQELLASAQSDDAFAAPKRRGRGAAFYFFAIAILGAGAVALLTIRPWERKFVAAADVVAAPVTPPSAPVVAAPTPIVPKVEPTVPAVAPAVPKVAPVAAVRIPPAAAAKTKAVERHAKHHAKRHPAKKHGVTARSSSKPAAPATDDPLAGVNL